MAKKAIKNNESLIYVGPTLPRGLCHHGTIFTGGVLPPHVADMVEKVPYLRDLIVPISQLGIAKQQLKVKGSFYYACYHNAIVDISKLQQGG